jgi:hypothetical protein
MFALWVSHSHYAGDVSWVLAGDPGARLCARMCGAPMGADAPNRTSGGAPVPPE